MNNSKYYNVETEMVADAHMYMLRHVSEHLVGLGHSGIGLRQCRAFVMYAELVPTEDGRLPFARLGEAFIENSIDLVMWRQIAEEANKSE